MSTRLVIVEGIPGSGKTSMARFAAEQLAARGRDVRLYLEGDLDQPADPESVACLTDDEFEAVAAAHPEWRDELEARAELADASRLVGYRKLEREFGERLPAELLEALAAHEVYELPPRRYEEIVGGRWARFAADAGRPVGGASRAQAADDVFVFECCFLQNPLTMLLGRHDEPAETARAFVRRLAEIVRPLDPLLVYLDPGPPGDVLRRVAAERPPEWLEFVIRYHTQQGTGKARGWQGFDGTVRFYEMRQAIERELLRELPLRSLVVPHGGWEEDRRRAAEFLDGAV